MNNLFRVCLHSEINKMTAKNLAVVFAPTIMRSPNESDKMLEIQELPAQQRIVEMLIKHTDLIFENA